MSSATGVGLEAVAIATAISVIWSTPSGCDNCGDSGISASSCRRVQLTRTNPMKLEALTRAMIARFRGLEGLIRELMTWHSDAQGRGDLNALSRFYMVVSQLILASDQLSAARETPVSALSDDELKRNLLSQVKQLVQEKPILVLWAASELGWEVTPPPESDVAIPLLE